MLSRSPSPSLFPDTPPMDEGFMVVPVWEPSSEVQIGSVVLEDPFLGFGAGKETPPSVRPVPRKAFAVATADAAFVGANSAAEPPQSAPVPVPVPAQPAPPAPLPPSQAPVPQPQPPYPLYPPGQPAYAEHPQPQPVPYAPPQGQQRQSESFHLESLRPANSGGDLGWWEESGPVAPFAAAIDAVDGPHSNILQPLDEFFQYPQEEEVTVGGSPEEASSAGEETSLKSPEDILNEIYAEANQLESSASEGSPAWEDDSATEAGDSEAPSPLDAAFDDAFRQDVLTAAEGPGGQAVLSLDAGSLPVEALRSGSQLNLVLRIKEPISRKRQGPKIRATVSIAPAPAAKKKKGGPAEKANPQGTRFRKTEAKERKKAQNRVAATKYREKKRSARDVLLKELDEETERQERLRRQEEDALNEIAYLRDLLHKVQHKKTAPEPHHEVVV